MQRSRGGNTPVPGEMKGGFTSNEIASWFVDHNHQLVDCVMEFV